MKKKIYPKGKVIENFVPKTIGTNQKIENSGQNFKYIRSKK